MPSIGAATQNQEICLEGMQFRQYDLIIIIVCKQFRVNLIELAKTI